MEAVQLFDLIERTIQSELDQTENSHIYLEREMRGTYPTLIVRVIPNARKRKPKAGAVLLSSPVPEEPEPVQEPETPENGSEQRTEPSPEPVGEST